ncbi:hypothetical protein, partial [Streptomyces zinciresistens]|uniref:hypothetical protein n=1 Tax=Streptomyces zinciresistens TaxID=1073330 RepID=UPI0011119AFB
MESVESVDAEVPGLGDASDRVPSPPVLSGENHVIPSSIAATKSAAPAAMTAIRPVPGREGRGRARARERVGRS